MSDRFQSGRAAARPSVSPTRSTGDTLDPSPVDAADPDSPNPDRGTATEADRGAHALLDAMPDGVIYARPGGVVLDMNRAMREMLGYDEADLAEGLTRADILADDEDTLRAFDEDRGRAGRIRSRVTYRRKDGTTFPAEVTSRLFRDDDGAEVAIVIVREITETIRREQELKASEERFAKAFRANPSPIVLFRARDGSVLDVNPAFTRTFGYGTDEVLGRTVAELRLVPDSGPMRRTMRALRKRVRLHEDEVAFRAKDGSIGFGMLSLDHVELNGEAAVVAMLHDISDRKAVEMQVEQERHFTEALIHSLPGVFYVHDGTRWIRWNENLEWVSGYDADELRELPLTALVEEADQLEAALREAREGGEFSFEGHLVTKDGRRVPHLFSGEGVMVHGGGYVVGMAIDIGERRRSEDALRSARERLARAEDLSFVMTLHADVDGTIIKVPPRLAGTLGYTAEELEGRSFRDITHPDDIGVEREPLQRLLDGEVPAVDIEKRYVRRDGESLWFVLNTSLVRDEEGRPQRFLTYVRDITEQKRAQEELRTRVRQQAAVAQLAESMSPKEGLQELLERATKLVSETLDAPFVKVLEVLSSGRKLLLRSGVGWEGVTPGKSSFRTGSHSLAGVTLQTDAPIVFPDLEGDLRFANIKLLHDHGVRSGVSVVIRGSEGPFGVLGAFSRERQAFTSDDANFLKSISGLLAGAIEQRRLLSALAHRAHHDELTGLPNRTLFEGRLQTAIRDAGRKGERVAVLFLDLDRFKNVNDTYGHHAGDELLRQIPQRISRCLRREDVLARLAGDEFVLMLPGASVDEDVVDVTQRILQCFDEPFELGGTRVSVKATIGICFYPDDGLDVEELLRGADTAMYQGKIAGRNTFEFYVPDMSTTNDDRMELEADLRRALREDQFELHYQPQVDLASGRAIGVEALLRWRHPERGLLLPDAFVPAAEECGLIVPIGAWVLERALRQQRAWRERGLAPGRMAVNVAAAQFAQASFVSTVRRLVRESGVPAEEVELEITESVVLHDATLIAAKLTALKGAGIGVALDDFGTGYSSLAYLRRLPIDRIKIDRAFTARLADDGAVDGRPFVEAIVGLARILELEVIAEGIETEAQLAVLRELNGTVAQGALFADAMPAEDLEVRLSAGAIRAGRDGAVRT